YLRYTAQPKHVYQLAVIIQELGRQRRFEIFKASLHSMENEEQKTALLNEWADDRPAKLRERYSIYAGSWDYANESEALSLARTLYNWVIIERITKKELDNRIQFFVFSNKPAPTTYMPAKSIGPSRSYKDAL
ncbi:hypothetical protein PHYSODRAFT_403839, partial [Phytophthora sojae]